MKSALLEDIASEPYAARGDDASNLAGLGKNLKNSCSECLKKGCNIIARCTLKKVQRECV